MSRGAPVYTRDELEMLVRYLSTIPSHTPVCVVSEMSNARNALITRALDVAMRHAKTSMKFCPGCGFELGPCVPHDDDCPYNGGNYFADLHTIEK